MGGGVGAEEVGLLVEGQQVRENLSRVPEGREGIQDWYRGMFREFLDRSNIVSNQS